MRYSVKSSFFGFRSSHSFFLLILGIAIPIFFLFALSRLAYRETLPDLFPLFIGVGFFLSLLFQKTGIFLSLLLSIAFYLLDLSNFSHPFFWKIILFISCFLTFFTAYLASQIVYSIWQAVQKKQMRKKKQFSWLKNAFGQKTQEYQTYVLSLRKTVEELKEQNLLQREMIKEKEGRIEQMQIEAAFVLQQKQDLIRDVFATRRELALEKLKEQVPITPEDKTLEEKWQNERSLHLQLRSQFQEKTELLAKTRKELFHLETLVLGQQKPVEETVVEKNLSYALQKTYQEIEELQEENLFLEQLVSILSSQS